MDFSFTPEQQKLKAEMDEFFTKELSPEYLDRWHAREEELWERLYDPEFAAKLKEKGWLGLQYTYGPIESGMIEESIGYWRAPVTYHFERVVGAAVMKFGTQKQKDIVLPALSDGSMTMSLGYTEPGVGSDLAALSTSATEDGDFFIVNGQKTYSSFAHYVTHMFTAVRTDPDVPKHKGISLLLIDLKSPGVTVRRLEHPGYHSVNEVYMDNVRVHKDWLIGEKNRGWYLLAGALDVQRSRVGEVGQVRHDLDEFIHYAKTTTRDGQPLSKDPWIRQQLAQAEIEVEVVRLLNYRTVWEATQDDIPPHHTSMAHTYGRACAKHLSKLGLELMGMRGLLHTRSRWAPMEGAEAREWLRTPAGNIAGGTAEIQRNIIAQRGLGLPRA